MTEINWKSLSEENKKNLIDINQSINKILEFQCKVNERLMIYLFGERLGNHYWDKFTREHSRNVLELLSGMDSNTKGDLIANIFLDENIYSNC
jgi:hypothetical protein